MAKPFTGIRTVAPARYVRGEQPFPYSECKRRIREHVDSFLAYTSMVQREGAFIPRTMFDAFRDDVHAMALETIACRNEGSDGHQVDINDRHQDLLLARYALKQARRLR